MEEEIVARKPAMHEIGQDLALLSVGELQARIALLHTEIERLNAAMIAKKASLESANAFFKR